MSAPQRLRFAAEEGTAITGAPSRTPGKTHWPDAVAYQEAIQNPAANLSDPDLSASSVAVNRRGLPLAYTGRFAVVFRLVDAVGDRWAVRCFTTAPGTDTDSRAVRYEILAPRLAASPVQDLFVPFRFQRDGMKVGTERFPALIMGWAEGESLGRFVERNLRSPAALLALAATLGDLWERLSAAGIAHGDWQHDNLLVREDGWKVTLVDYDGVYIDELSMASPSERGHPNYQHPTRTAADYGPDLDRFPCLLMQTALLALATEPTLWQSFSDGESLLFRKADLDDPETSALFQTLHLVSDAESELGAMVAALEASCSAGAPVTPVARAIFERAAVRRRLSLNRPEPQPEVRSRTTLQNPTPTPKLGRETFTPPRPTDAAAFVVEVEEQTTLSPQVTSWMDSVRRMVRRHHRHEAAHLWTLRLIYLAMVIVWFAPPTDWWTLHSLLWGSIITAVGFYLWPTNQIGLKLEEAHHQNFRRLEDIQLHQAKTQAILRGINERTENLSAVAFVAARLQQTRLSQDDIQQRTEMTEREVIRLARIGIASLNDVSAQIAPPEWLGGKWDSLLALKRTKVQEAQEAYAAIDRQRRDLQKDLDRADKERAGLLEIGDELKGERTRTGEPSFSRFLGRVLFGFR